MFLDDANPFETPSGLVILKFLNHVCTNREPSQRGVSPTSADGVGGFVVLARASTLRREWVSGGARELISCR